MPEDCFANSLQQFTVYAAPWVSRFAQPVADAKMEFAIRDDMVQGAVVELYVYGMIGTAGAHADQG